MDLSRNKLSLQGLLKFAVEQTKAEDASDSHCDEINKEDYEFLQNALKSMTVDIIKEFESAVNILKEESSRFEQRKESLNKIRSYIDDLDLANNFVKFGGGHTILYYSKKAEPELQAIATSIIAEMSQNNPYCQSYFCNEGVLPFLISNMNNSDENLARNSIYAVSSLVRNFNPGLNEFLRNDGIPGLVLCLNSPRDSVYIKAAFLVASLSSQDSVVKEEFKKTATIPALLQNLEIVSDFNVKLETTLFALNSLSSGCPWNIDDQKLSDCLLLLRKIISQLKTLDTCRDIVNYAKSILANLETTYSDQK